MQAYNTLLKNVLVSKYKAMGRNITFVDQYHNFVDAKGNVIAARLPDTVHPDRTGYDLIGDTWYQAIKQATGATKTAK